MSVTPSEAPRKPLPDARVPPRERESGARRKPSVDRAAPLDAPCATCRGHTVIDRGFDPESDADLILECPDC